MHQFDEGEGSSALAVAADEWRRSVENAPQPRLVGSILATICNAFVDALPSPDFRVDPLEDAYTDLVIAWNERFRDHPVSVQLGSELLAGDAPKPGYDGTWIRQARALSNELLTGRTPFTASGRDAFRRDKHKQFVDLVHRLPSARLAIYHEGWSWRAENGGAIAADAMHEAMTTWSPMPHPPSPIAPYERAVQVDDGLESGPGPVNVFVGTMRPVEVQVTSTRPGRRDPVTHRLPVPSVAIPIVLNLDGWGGFRSDSHETVQSVVLHLLAAMPAGELQVRVFDPDRLGKSANFLYGLGDATEKVIGDKVKTTPAELAQLLAETEEHITFVTQKYLQGAFASLTEYNSAAQDVTEPYRLLLIHDYPSGFSRDASHDREQFDRLLRIIDTGRRCGVFVIVLCESVQSSAVAGALNVLPWLGRSHLNPGIAAHGLGVDQSVSSGWSAVEGVTSNVEWEWSPLPQVKDSVAASLLAHVQRGLVRATDKQVLPTRVAELARRSMERDVERGIRSAEVVVDPYRPDTWWRGSTMPGITGLVGQLSGQGVAPIVFDSRTSSSVLIGGRPGSGKSVLLHSLILSLAQAYSPDELELYLVDFKEGVEFKQYATYGLPHARVVAIESERDFGVSVLEALANEIAQRGQLFRDAGTGAENNIGEYRTRTGKTLPRVLLIIDEFQVLFDRDDRIGTRAAELLELVLRTGRAFGVHVAMASQTIAGMPALGRHLHNLIPTRISLQVSEADSRLLLAEDNPDARLLQRPGEGILNTKGGLRDANQRFQATYWSPDERAAVLEQMGRHADEHGLERRPIVFEGQRLATVLDVPAAEFTMVGSRGLSLPVGTPMDLGGPVRAHLRREPGGNLLVVTKTPGVIAVILACLNSAKISTTVLDFAGADPGWLLVAETTQYLEATALVHRRATKETLQRLSHIVDGRLALEEYAGVPECLVLGGLHRAREFDPSAEYEPDSASGYLKNVLVNGPEVGVHVVAWVDMRASLERRMSNDLTREFSLRLVGPVSREDSMMLVDSDDAAGLKAGQAVLDDLDGGKRDRLRLFGKPPNGWMADLDAVTDE